MATTRTFSRCILLILVATVGVAWTAPQQSKGASGAGTGCRLPATNTTEGGAECRPDQSGAYYEGDCWPLLLQQGPCPPMHWLVLDKATDRGVCQLKVCADHEVLVGDRCERLGKVSSSRHCAPTQMLVITDTGEHQCECPLGTAYYAADERCYHPYEQGPCQQGHALQVVFRGDQAAAECVVSVCPSGEVALTRLCEEPTTVTGSDEEYRCYKLSSPGPCKEGFLALNPHLNRATCIENAPYDILRIRRSSGCIPGSRRDKLGTCREKIHFGRR